MAATMDRIDGHRTSTAALIATGLGLQALLVVFTLLYVNIPPGYDVPYGLSLQSVKFFRALWPYPVVRLSADTLSRVAAFTVVALWGVYVAAAFVLLRRQAAEPRQGEIWVILGFAGLYNLELALILPSVLSSDVYHYALFGRMVALYGLNPYVVPGTAINHDPFWSLAVWHDITTQYGPVWTLLSAALAAIGSRSVLLTIVLFKVLAAAMNMAAAVLVYRLARALTGGDGVVPLLLYAWNPLILLESAGSAHNDVVMIALALGGLLLAIRGRLLAGLAVLLASAMVKYLTMLLVLFYVAHCITRETSWKRMAAATVRLGTVSMLVLAVLYAPFLSGIGSVRQLVAGLSLNPMPNPVSFLVRAGVARALASWKGTAASGTLPEGYAALLLHLGFAVLLLVLLRRVVARSAGWPQVAGSFGLASLVYAYVVFGASFPWYLISPLSAEFICPPTKANTRFIAVCLGLGVGFTLGYTKLIPV